MDISQVLSTLKEIAQNIKNFGVGVYAPMAGPGAAQPYSTGALTAPTVKSGSGTSVPTPTNAPITLMAAPAGMTFIFMSVPGGGAQGHGSFATVVNDGVNSRISATDGSLSTLTLSGNSIQALQLSGSNQSISYTYLTIG